MDYKMLLSDLKSKKYAPLYFLYGAEPYYIDRIAEYAEAHILTETEKVFNLSILYGLETDSHILIATARRFPMMSNYQVIILKEAQQMRNIEALVPYLEKPVPSTILFICYKKEKLDWRSSFVKVIKKTAVIFESKKLAEDKLPKWMTAYAEERGYMLEPRAALLLTEYLGNDLSKIANELDKLFTGKSSGDCITLADIEHNIGISREYNIFELQQAIGNRHVMKANRIVHYFAANERAMPFPVIIGSLYSYFSKLFLYHTAGTRSRDKLSALMKLPPFFLNEYEAASKQYSLEQIESIIELLHEYDLRSKGIDNYNIRSGEMLRELVYRILH